MSTSGVAGDRFLELVAPGFHAPSSIAEEASMAHQFTRQELYDLVWAEPMKTVSARFGLSDVGLAKACRRADIPLLAQADRIDPVASGRYRDAMTVAD